ncbi:MAG: hypothetical protein IH994_06000 [Proteobacteria bacterium]|nr:hypothetical protein [Pseudomonadota bacterium]
MSREFDNEMLLDGVVDYLRNNPDAGFTEAHEATKEKLINMIHGAPLEPQHPPSPEDVPTREDGSLRERHPDFPRGEGGGGDEGDHSGQSPSRQGMEGCDARISSPSRGTPRPAPDDPIMEIKR